MRLSNIQNKFGEIYGELLSACSNQAEAAYVALEVSKLNGCSYCIQMHTRELAQFSELELEKLEHGKMAAIVQGVVKCEPVARDHYDIALIEYAILVNSFNRVGKLA
ncbi:hypothetical protein EK599_10690 [Vibrio sp. T187]|uniref:carboxymuconolactone decarboxylase family protein n=1 Tax=Vibrio TaxID=662 RepID=UPI0010C9F005|nr:MULTISPECIES: carboxymuconolactone decarboxylase family protein [Vibrio]MBW3696166.1 hypothetical protein [Vibrio sp. T187]